MCEKDIQFQRLREIVLIEGQQSGNKVAYQGEICNLTGYIAGYKMW